MLKKYYFRLIIGSILFGLIVFGKEVYKDGSWHFSGLLWVVYGTVGFGILFHILFRFIIKEYEEKDKHQ